MGRALRISGPLLAGLVLACSLQPSDERPGLWLTGEVVSEPVGDWSFTRELVDVFIETRTAYLLPHSVTIWCVSIDGKLYVGASAPDEKRWVANVARDPNVRLGLGGRVYERRLEAIPDPAELASIDRAFGQKYGYDPAEDTEPVAYWRVVDRD